MTTLTVPVKPYIKKYLEKNYGNPVNFSGVRGLNDFFCLLLEKQTQRYDKRTTLSLYDDEVTIVVTRDVFYRYGWTMTSTSVVSFNSLFEFIIKTRTRDIIGVRKNDAKLRIAPSIRQLQLDFDFTEDNFSFDAIKKDIQRHTQIFNNGKKRFGANVSKNKALCLEE